MRIFLKLFVASVIVLSTAIVASIQFVDANSFGTGELGKACANTIVDRRLSITFAFSSLAGLLTLLSTVFFTSKEVQAAFRESIMDGIFEQVLDNDKNTARITLFKDVRFFRKNWYRFKDFISLLRQGMKLRDVWEYCYNANYIRIASRWGNHHRNSKTYFYVNLEDASKCQGIAGQIRQKEIEVVKTLPRLDGVDLQKADENHPTVSEVLRDGYIPSMRILRTIKKVAPFFYGHIIFAQGGKKKLVLVIDAWGADNPFSVEALKALAIYRKQISASFGG